MAQSRPKFSKKQQTTLDVLEKMAKGQGLKISAGQLRFGGLRLKGGNCLLRGRKWLVLDRSQPFEEQAEIFRSALTGLDLDLSAFTPEEVSAVSSYLPDLLPKPGATS